MSRFDDSPVLRFGKKRNHGFSSSHARIHPALEALEAREVPAGVSVVYTVTQDWTSGFQGTIQIKNDTAAPVNDWKLEFDYTSKITDIWDAKKVSQSGNHYVINNGGWNGTIPAGGSVSFGFVAAPPAGGTKSAPTNFLVNGAPLGGSTPALPSISVADVQAKEGNSGKSPMNFTVNLSAASTKTVSVNYSFVGVTATAGQDFDANSGVVTFAPGQTSKVVALQVAGDTATEGDETVKMVLSTPVNATLSTAQAIGTIVNDDFVAGTGSVRLVVNSDWVSGFTGTITMSNNDTRPMTNWKMEFDFDGTLTQIWDAKQLTKVGNHWTFGDAGWNATIPANGSVSFGFNATPGATMPKPINLVWKGTPGEAVPPGGGGGGTPTNQAPTAVDDQVWYVPGSVLSVQPLINDTDPDNDKLSITAIGAPSHGKAVLNADSTVSYTPDAGYKGADSFTYTISDGKNHTASAKVNLTALAEGVKTWPANVFAPYVDVGLYPTFDMVNVAKTQGVKYFSLGFITADPNKQPAWGGYSSYAITGTEFDLAMRNQVQQIRALGGDVTPSFGGASNQELAEVITDPTALKAAYAKVVDAYGLTRIDFDIEGGALANKTYNDRRSQAVAALQKERDAAGKPLEVWLTLPVLPTGLTADGLYAVNSMLKAGVRLGGVNVMAMDYGDSAAPNPSGKMGDYAIQAGTSTFNQLKTIYAGALTDAKIWSMIGITPMIGLNDITTEVFDQQEAREVLAWAKQKNIGLIAMWDLNRDFQNANGKINYVDLKSSSLLQTPYEFSNIFKAFVP